MPCDFQAILLSFFGQELVAHAAAIFAALAAAFIFMRDFRPEKQINFWRRLGYSTVSGLLIVLVVYLGFRMLFYGQLANIVTTYDPRPGDAGLSQYYGYVVEKVTEKAARPSTSTLDWIYLQCLNFAAVFRYPTNSLTAVETMCLVWLIWIIGSLACFYRYTIISVFSRLRLQASSHGSNGRRASDISPGVE